mgnify:CR=1 FL=1
MDILDFMKKLREYLKDKEFHSFEELNQAIEKFIEKENQTPFEKFCGLSPYKMMRFLYFPFDSPDVVSFDINILPPLDAPFVRLFVLLINGIHETKSLKATATGNLPRNFCRELEKAYLSEADFKFLLRDKFSIMKEQDFFDLHRVRIIAEMAGYIKKYKKRFILTKRGKNVIAKGFTIDDYLHLLKTFTLRFNWAYFSILEEIDIVQDSFLFTLYLLQTFGNKFRPKKFYADKFITAFSHVLKNIRPHTRFTSIFEKIIRDTYIWMAIDLFAVAWGFAETKEKSVYLSRFNKYVRKTSFLDEFIEFK